MGSVLKLPDPSKLSLEPFYHRGNLMGWIEPQPDGRYNAVTYCGVALGRFNDVRAAASALIAAKAL